jgi:hypothetical protein
MQTQDSTKAAKLKAKLQKVLRRLEEVEREIREMERGWLGSPLVVNPAQYMHDWVLFTNVARARSHYLWLLEEREALREMAHALQRRLMEVRP